MTSPAPPGSDAQALLGQARRLSDAGHTTEAIHAYREVLRRWPQWPNAWYNLAALEKKGRHYEAALASYQQALERGITRPEEVHVNRGVIYAEHLRRDDAAEREWQTALGVNPTHVPALLNLANLHEDRGHRQAALALYERALTVDPEDGFVLARYANVMRFSRGDEPLIGRLRQALAAPRTSAPDRADLGFALGRALDACGLYDAAFEAYVAANQSSRESGGAGFAAYDRTAFERYVDDIIRAFPPPATGAASSASVLREPTAPAQPIFICGMFRSGSTLIEQLLAGHPRVAAGGELDWLPHLVQQDLAPFPQSLSAVSAQHLAGLAGPYLDALAALAGDAAFVTDKRPDNFLYIGLIKRLFPAVKIVHTRRNALDNCLSLYFLHLDHGKSYALDLEDTGHYFRHYQRLMTHWQMLYGEDLIDVDYDVLVGAPTAVMQRLLQRLGLDWDERCLAVPADGRSVKTASVWQVREPLHTRSSGRAVHYAKQLEPLRRYLPPP